VLVGALFHVYLPRVTQFEARQNLEFSAVELFLLIVFVVAVAGHWTRTFKGGPKFPTLRTPPRH
jgi:hypothetical protein